MTSKSVCKLSPSFFEFAQALSSRSGIETESEVRKEAKQPEGRTYTLLRNVARPHHPAGQEGACHPAGKRKGQQVAERRTVAQRLAEAEAKAARLREVLTKTERRDDTHRKCAIAGAVLAEAKEDPELATRIREIVRKRVTRAHDLAVVSEWLSST